MTPTEVFDDIYRRKAWGDGSGGGSCPSIARPWCNLVERAIGLFHAARVLDIGCGDGRLAKAINWGGAHYTGIDVARAALHVHPMHDLRLMDALVELPGGKYDLVLLKEVTQHMPNAAITALMGRLKRYPMILHCSGIGGVANGDIVMGDSRYVDLAAAPFHLPAREVLRYGDYVCQLIEW